MNATDRDRKLPGRKRAWLVIGASWVVGLSAFLALRAPPDPALDASESVVPGDDRTRRADPVQVERGRYLALAGNCAGCHTRQGDAPYAGGAAIPTPFGAVMPGNLTPDPETGLGRWSRDDFWRALNQGRSRDGRLLVPAFPYTDYTHVTRDDADALFAFLRSLDPVQRANPPHRLRFPYNTQLALRVWQTLYFKPGTTLPDATQSAQWQRGAYLVRGLGHCASCHAGRDAWGGPRDPRGLGGGMIPAQDWYAPSLSSPNDAGVQDWELEDVVRLLRDGSTRHASVLGPMAGVVATSLQHLAEPDLLAMATYLRALPRTAQATEPLSARAAMAHPERGEKLYGEHCQGCHGAQGEGADGLYLPLARNRAVLMANPTNLIRVVLSGGFAPSTRGHPRPFGMPPFAGILSDADIAAVLTHVRQSWGGQAAEVRELDVVKLRSGGSGGL